MQYQDSALSLPQVVPCPVCKEIEFRQGCLHVHKVKQLSQNLNGVWKNFILPCGSNSKVSSLGWERPAMPAPSSCTCIGEIGIRFDFLDFFLFLRLPWRLLVNSGLAAAILSNSSASHKWLGNILRSMDMEMFDFQQIERANHLMSSWDMLACLERLCVFVGLKNLMKVSYWGRLKS